MLALCACFVLDPPGSMSTGSSQVMYPPESLHWDIPEQSLCLHKLSFDWNLNSVGPFSVGESEMVLGRGNAAGIPPALWLGAASLQPQFTLCLLILFFPPLSLKEVI